MTTSLIFEKMDESAFSLLMPHLIKEYAQDKIDNKHWKVQNFQEALQLAQESFQNILPKGPKTFNHFFYFIIQQKENLPLGYLWYHLRHSPLGHEAYIYFIKIYQKYQNQGYGKEVFHLLETKLKQERVEYLSLHVFGKNIQAQNFYEKIGFEKTSLIMNKTL